MRFFDRVVVGRSSGSKMFEGVPEVVRNDLAGSNETVDCLVGLHVCDDAVLGIFQRCVDEFFQSGDALFGHQAFTSVGHVF